MSSRRVFVMGMLAAICSAALRCAPEDPAPQVSARWPGRPDAGTVATDTPLVYAIDAFEFAPTYGKEAHGWDLDGKITEPGSTDVCTPARGTPSTVQQDHARGNLIGIDNSFEANVAPLLRSIAKTVDLNGVFTNAIRAGEFTLQLETRGLESSRGATTVDIATQAFASGRFDGGTPKFTLDETWPVRSDLVADGGPPFTSLTRLDDGWVVDGTFVSGTGDVVIAGVFQGEPFDLRVHAARVVATAAGDELRGTLSGVVDVKELVAEFRRLLALGSATFCGRTADGIAEQIRQCADILRDGTNVGGVPCDGISFGVGFTARRIGSPIARVPSELRQPVCPDPFAGVTCRSASDCGDAGTPTCCVNGTLTDCKLDSASTKCVATAASCPWSTTSKCGSWITARTCTQKSDCANTFAPFCCAVGAGLSACVANDIAAGLECAP